MTGETDATDDTGDDADDQPEIEPDEQAEFSIPDGMDSTTVEDEAGADVDDSDTEEADDETGDDAQMAAEELAPETGEWGEMYVSLCQTSTNAVIQKHGDGHEVPKAHFEDVDLGEHFNDTMEKLKGDSNMPPEQALVVGTALAVGGPVALHTDLLDDAFGDLLGGA